MAGASGFWSYVQADDHGDNGRIIALSGDLRAQYQIHTAEELDLFVDRESIQWGEEWGKLIEEAIAGTTFFIPIITPSYFRSEACRQELLKFVRAAVRTGLDRLLMPIYWVTVAELDHEGSESRDEAIGAIAAHQWRDLRDARLEDRGSSAYRKAVNGLAEEIASRASEVAASVDDLPTVEILTRDTGRVSRHGKRESEKDEDGLGYPEPLMTADEAVEKFAPVAEELGKDIQEARQLAQNATNSLQAAMAHGQGTRTALTITERYAYELDRPASRLQEHGREYFEYLVKLDTAMELHLGLADMELPSDVDESKLEILTAVEPIADNVAAAYSEVQELYIAINETSRMSRSLTAPANKMRAGLLAVVDGKAITDGWKRRADAIRMRRRYLDADGA